MEPASTPVDQLGDRLRSLDLDALRRRDVIKWRGPGMPYCAWVADMDFPVADAVANRLTGVVDRQEMGYPVWSGAVSPAAEAFADRMTRRYEWSPDRDRLVDTADVLQGVQIAIEALSNPGDGIVIHLPAYYPFLLTVDAMRRPVVPVLAGPHQPGDQPVVFDYDDLERRLATTRAKIWILCHPHNPLGHVFTPAELARIADIAERHDLIVISDEVHADLRYGAAGHAPFAKVADPARVVTVSSASKAFNLAGLRWAVMHVGPERLVDYLDAYPSHFFGAANRMGVDAAVAAWTAGDRWLDEVLVVLNENRLALVDLLAEHLPGARYRPPDATYLAWVDVTGCDLGADAVDPAEVFGIRGVAVSSGAQFGAPGVGHVRINFATSPAILAATIAQMGTADA